MLIFVLFLVMIGLMTRAINPLITKEAQERDVVDPGRLKEAAAFERIRLLCFFYFLRQQGLWTLDPNGRS